MPTQKKVSSKKKMVKPIEVCLTDDCCGEPSGVMSALLVIFGGLVVSLSFFLLQTTL